MDDFSMDLLPTMRSAAAMRRAGAWYSHAFVVDSYCCPSRTSLMTGQYPHQTGVRTNVPGERSIPLGGFEAYDAFGNAERSFNVSLQAAGYTTGFFGKFLNHYERRPTAPCRALAGVVGVRGGVRDGLRPVGLLDRQPRETTGWST